MRRRSMDPIDHIAYVFTLYCREYLHSLIEVKRVVDEHSTLDGAMSRLVLLGLIQNADPERLKAIEVDIPRMKRCLARIKEIKTFARYVYQCNFPEEERYFIFSQEISFSYASKMLVSTGLELHHFSNSPTSAEIVRAEISLAMRTPLAAFSSSQRPPARIDTTTKRAIAVTVPPHALTNSANTVGIKSRITKRSVLQKFIRPPASASNLTGHVASINDLLCRESMPSAEATVKQTRPLPRAPPSTSGPR